ncbi:MAG: hypothetical protein HC822_12715 [Oscillochloris sp.]|nr:hypothetical protein [Oscillochloris sp.]
MTASITISTAPLEHPAMDYDLLRQAGIRRLEQLAGRLWTDFNTHDPGITILEQLCYAISDLGYRIDYDLKDLLAGDADPYHSLYSPAEILTTSPVTLRDLRKVLLDIDGVRNAWIEPLETPQPALYYDPADERVYMEPAAHRSPMPLRGIYQVLIDADRSGSDLELFDAVRQRLNACRALGEAFELRPILSKQPISVTAMVEVGPTEDPDRLLAEIYHALAHVISPRIRFYNLTELLDRGRPIDEIMDGPPLRHGFIDNAELTRLDRKDGLRASDLIQVMMDVPAVRAVDDVSLSDGVKSDPWYLSLSEAANQNRAPVLDIETDGFAGPTIKLTRNGAVVQPTPAG